MPVILQPPSLLSLSLIAVCSITLAVQPLPPRVTRPPTIVPDPNLNDIVYFDTEGEHPTELPCQALGSSPMKYLWTKNGDPLDVNDPKYISNTTKISKIVLKNANKGTIQMTELKEDDEGIYQCKAENRYGVSKSKTITLEKATKKSFAEFSEKTYKKPVGSFLKMECNAPDNNPPSKKRWLKYSFQGESQQYLDLNKRIAVDFDGNLYFANVQKIDENGNEKYACECSLQSLVGIKIEGAYSYIKVDNSKTGPRNVQQQFPTELQYNSPTKVTALKGESFMLKCIFSGNPTPDIEWRRIKGGQIDTDRMVQRNQNFLVRDVGYADEGTYECRGSNGVPAGKGPITRRFEVKVEGPSLPIVTQVHSHMEELEELVAFNEKVKHAVLSGVMMDEKGSFRKRLW